ncbi:trypsin-like serine peptidase [Ideonella paludis]|uniref:trypsin-like serine peptidase n=1 Tax=Ideonella paludis TaxID=1233411 RepID=UPI00362A560A
MSFAFTSRRLTTLALATAALGLASAAQADNKNLPVASDGTMPSLVVTSTVPGGAFAGHNKRGVALDAEAEFPASRLTAAEQAVFAATFKPKMAPYASAAEALDPESVINSDRRFRVYPQESGYPYRAVGLLTFNQGSGSFSCTAWLISNNTVATAGHCVHSGGSTGCGPPTWCSTRLAMVASLLMAPALPLACIPSPAGPQAPTQSMTTALRA